MRKRIWIVVTVLAVLCLVIGGGGVAVYRASQQVPDFYTRALAMDPVVQAEASDKMLQKTSNLVSDLKREGEWQALFTAEEINGWLAVDLVKNHPGAIPDGVSDPRVDVDPVSVTLACRVDNKDIRGVLSLKVEPYIAEPNVIAIRVREVRLGAVPLPLKQVLDSARDAARQMDIQLEWQQADGDPVALVSVPPAGDKDKRGMRLDAIRLAEGEIYVSGTTERRRGGRPTAR